MTFLESNREVTLRVLGLSFFIVACSFFLQSNVDLSLWDEGFLWYGTQRVLLGEVPTLDFMAYEPGRYYWSALIMSLNGDNGILSLRMAVAVFQFLGLFVAMMLIVSQEPQDKNSGRYLYWIVCAVILVLWMYPRHKLFDVSLSIFSIGAITYLIQKPILIRYFITGCLIGGIAVFGRNHGVYGAIASVGVILWLGKESELNYFKAFFFWGLGVVIGFLPVILMVLFIPDFAVAFWESIIFLFKLKTTNLPLPIPWPWLINFSEYTFLITLEKLFIGLLFVMTLLFAVWGIGVCIINKTKKVVMAPALVASISLALPYSHFAFSRADLPHLTQSIFPLLVGGFVLLSTKKVKEKWIFVTILFFISFIVILPHHEGWKCATRIQCEPTMVLNDQLYLPKGTANDVTLLQELSDKYTPDGQSFIVTPFWPGAYALLERRSPMWEIYALFPRSQEFQGKELERIRESKPQFVFIYNIIIDNREELRFKNSHNIIYNYIIENFDALPQHPNKDYQIFKSKSVTINE